MADLKNDREMFCPKELSAEDLEKVTGGTSMPALGAKLSGYDFKSNISKKVIVINRNNCHEWAICTIVSSGTVINYQFVTFDTIETNNNEEYDFCKTGTIKAGKQFSVGEGKIHCYLVS